MVERGAWPVRAELPSSRSSLGLCDRRHSRNTRHRDGRLRHEPTTGDRVDLPLSDVGGGVGAGVDRDHHAHFWAPCMATTVAISTICRQDKNEDHD